jgi:hypothetical protein
LLIDYYRFIHTHTHTLTSLLYHSLTLVLAYLFTHSPRHDPRAIVPVICRAAGFACRLGWNSLRVHAGGLHRDHHLAQRGPAAQREYHHTSHSLTQSIIASTALLIRSLTLLLNPYATHDITHLQVSDESLPTFNDQLRLMDFSGAPSTVDDLTPPHQRVMFNSYLHSAHGNNYFTGYKGAISLCNTCTIVFAFFANLFAVFCVT